jgi:hypothetical protein
VTLGLSLMMQLAWLGGKRRQNRLQAAADTRAARLSGGASADGLGRLPAPLRHSAWLQEHDSQAVNMYPRSVAFQYLHLLASYPRLVRMYVCGIS